MARVRVRHKLDAKELRWRFQTQQAHLGFLGAWWLGSQSGCLRRAHQNAGHFYSVTQPRMSSPIHPATLCWPEHHQVGPESRAGDGRLKRTALRSHCLEENPQKTLGWEILWLFLEIPACYWTICKSVWQRFQTSVPSRSRKHGLSLWSELRHREACRCTVTSLLT